MSSVLQHEAVEATRVRLVAVVHAQPESEPEPQALRAKTPLAVRIRRISDAAVVLIFLFAVLTPLYGYLFRTPPPNDENRELARFPTISTKKYVIQDFAKWFEIHFNDHVGYRDVLLDYYRLAMNRGFHMSSSPKAWIGQEDWIYLNVDDPDRINPSKPTLDQKAEAWADVLADRQVYLAARGIAYIVMIAPEKSAVYPEYLPPRRKRSQPPEPSALLAAKLKSRGVRCVNLLPSLLAAKEGATYPLYYRTDTHWSPDGARIGYKEFAKELSAVLPGFAPEPDSRFEMYEDTGGGDIWKFVGPPETFVPEACRRYPARDRVIEQSIPAFAALLDPEDNRVHVPLRTYTTKATGPTLLLLRDSFATDMLPFFTADFGRVTAIPSHRFPLVALNTEKPRIVVQQMVARTIYLEKAMNPAGVR